MRAVVYDRYGPPDVLRLAEVPRPVPKDGEVLVKVHATAVTRADCATRDANRKGGLLVSVLSRLVSGVRTPRRPILGSEFAGEVVELGPGVTEFAAGDMVFGSTGFGFGGYAEYLAIPASGRMARIPRGLGFEQGAAITDGGLNSLWCLRLGDVKPGTSALVYGASGAIGSAAVQLAKHFGADVTAVTTAPNFALASSLGASRVIDYSKEDFRRGGDTYDVVFDAVGKLSFLSCRSALKPGGRYLATDGLGNFVMALWTRRFGDRKAIFKLPPRYTKRDVELLRGLVESGEFRPVMDRRYPMEEVVEASRYVETERKVGNVILTIVPEAAR